MRELPTWAIGTKCEWRKCERVAKVVTPYGFFCLDHYTKLKVSKEKERVKH